MIKEKYKFSVEFKRYAEISEILRYHCCTIPAHAHALKYYVAKCGGNFLERPSSNKYMSLYFYVRFGLLTSLTS